jgi:hypothetical protein
MGQVIRLGAKAQPVQQPRAASPETLRHALLVGALVSVIVLALGMIVYVSWPKSPPNIVAGGATPDASDDSAVFEPRAAAEQQRLRQAEQEKEDSAVFGQASSAATYATSSR